MENSLLESPKKSGGLKKLNVSVMSGQKIEPAVITFRTPSHKSVQSETKQGDLEEFSTIVPETSVNTSIQTRRLTTREQQRISSIDLLI